MTDPYRYLPCALHEALYASEWSSYGEATSDEPFVYKYVGPKGEDEDLGPDETCEAINLAHPSGWDHAVRAYATIEGVEVPESSSVLFLVGWRQDDARWGELYVDGNAAASRALTIKRSNKDEPPSFRREALCRCICAALNLEVDVVFPVEPS